VDRELLHRIDGFWHDNRFPTRAEAVRWLIQPALDKKLAPKATGKKD
jgi:metal-responsive CopG/Arc/MetJ family transcriptional regulator